MGNLNPSSKFSISSLVNRLEYNHKVSRFEAYSLLLHLEEKIWEREDGKVDGSLAQRFYVQAYNVLDRFYSVKSKRYKENYYD